MSADTCASAFGKDERRNFRSEIHVDKDTYLVSQRISKQAFIDQNH